MKQEMMGWQWHQLDHLQIVCTSLQTDNHTSTTSSNFLQAGCSSQQRQSTEGNPVGQRAHMETYSESSKEPVC